MLAALLAAGLLLVRPAHAASWVVAAHNSLPEAKARANVVCNGTADQVVLAASMRLGPLVRTEYDDNAYTNAYSGQNVEWLAGDYFLSDTLFIAQSVDSVLHAEGTILHYQPTTGDAVVVTGTLRCRYYFGTIWTGSSGAALAMKDRPYSSPFMPNLMSVFYFQGLQQDPPTGANGVGLYLMKHFCVNKVEGTDIRGFRTGVFVDDAGEGKVDTNWYWLSYVRGCGTDIQVSGQGVDSQHWYVNVDATIPNSVAVRTAAVGEHWDIIMGTASRDPGSRSIILDPGAQMNWMYVTPPLWTVDGYENNSGFTNNVIAQTPSGAAARANRSNDPAAKSHLVLNMSPFADGAAGPVEGGAGRDPADLLRQLKALFTEGLITEAEYAAKRKDVLDRHF